VLREGTENTDPGTAGQGGGKSFCVAAGQLFQKGEAMDIAVSVVPNSKISIRERVAAHKISWPRPILMLFSRLVLFAAWQGVVALAFALRGSPDPWGDSVAWWPLTVTLTNLVSIVFLRLVAKAEGLRLRDLYRVERHSFWRELLLSLGALVICGPLSMLPNTLLGNLLFGDVNLTAAMMFRPLPVAAVYGLMLLLVVTQPFAELPTYFSYVMPRLAALTGKGWAAVIVAAFMLGAQHVAFPLIFDVRFILWRLLMFLPLALWIGFALYKRPRLLPYLMVGHALLDFTLLFMLLPAAY
jgi:hypothetical protein